MQRAQMIDWLKTEFHPLTIPLEDKTLSQILDRVFRYFNTHAAYKHIEMVQNVSVGTGMVQLSNKFSTVAEVYPAANNLWVLQNHPLWTLLGVSVLDNITSDLIQMYAAFQTYRFFIGNDFRWTVLPAQDPEIGPQLMLANLPQSGDIATGAIDLCVIGARRYGMNEDILAENVLEWMLDYFKALVKQSMGELLRKGDIDGIPNDGQRYVDDGAKEEAALKERLGIEGRWLVFGQRF